VSDQPAFVRPVIAPGEAAGAGWSLRDESALSKLLVHEDFESDGLIAERLGVGFASAVTAGDGTLVCGVRPGEWLLLGDGSGETAPAGGAVTVDLTHGMAMFRLTGPEAPDVLAAVCSIDTSGEMMPDGAVCGASVARVSCTLVRNDVAGELSYLILSPRSSGRYLFDAVRDAGVR
jgi:sarcosine oxidase subunit alpha